MGRDLIFLFDGIEFNTCYIYSDDIVEPKFKDLSKEKEYPKNWLNFKALNHKNSYFEDNKCEIVKDPYSINNRQKIWYNTSNRYKSFFSNIQLFEQKSYYIRIKSHSNNQEEFDIDNLIPNLKFIKKINSEFFSKKYSGITINKRAEKKYEINFNNFTGKIKIRDSFESKQEDLVEIEILSRKLSDKNYIALLKNVDRLINETLFQLKSPTKIAFSRKFIQPEIKEPRGNYYAQFLLLKTIMSILPQILIGLRQILNRKFIYPKTIIPLYKVRAANNILLADSLILSNNLVKDESSLALIENKYTLLNFIIRNKELSYDTSENQFVKFVLKKVLSGLKNENISKLFKQFKEQKSYKKFLNYLSENIESLNRLDIENLNLAQFNPFSSQILQKNDYYKQFLNYYMWMINPAIFDINRLFNIEIKPMDKLYEFYCFYIFKLTLDEIFQKQRFDVPSLSSIEVFEDPKEQNYLIIKSIVLNYQKSEPNRKYFSLIYSPKGFVEETGNSKIWQNLRDDILEKGINPYSSDSHEKLKKPDYIFLEFEIKEGLFQLKNRNIVVLDAKFRQESTELWMKMHAYKDALQCLGAIFACPDTNDFKSGSNIDLKYQKEEIASEGFVGKINLLGLKQDQPNMEEIREIFIKIINGFD